MVESDGLLSPNCCFNTDDFDLCSLLSWTGLTDSSREEAEWYQQNSPYQKPAHLNRAQHDPRQHRYYGRSAKGDYPPPVIALSRSSFSSGSASSAESALETTEVDRHQDHNRRARQLLSRLPGRGRDRDSFTPGNHSGLKDRTNTGTHGGTHEATNYTQDPNAVDYAARHELLINALFADAKHRQGKRATDGANDIMSCKTPPRPTNVSRSISVASRRSSASGRSTGSDLLSPAAHHFKKNLKTKRKCKHRASMMTNPANRKRLNSKSSQRGHNGIISVASTTSPGRTNEDSSCTSLTTFTNDNDRACAGDIANSFLHSQCQLQKDSGKGLDPGSVISASGRLSAMAKLVEKMDLLAEVEQDGSLSNAVLTRVPAKNMTLARREANYTSRTASSVDSLEERGFVETRSVVAVKIGFISLRYGILVHWNIATGLAELIVLRKNCQDSFMKLKSSSLKTSKSWRKRMRMMSANANMNAATLCAAPSMITVNSAESWYSSFDGLELEAAETY